MDISRKFEEARSVMKSYGKDCMILAPSTDLRYLSGFHGISMERPILLILTLKRAFFVLPEFELDNLREELKAAVTCISWKEQEDLYAKAAQALEQENICHAVFGNQMQAVMFYRLKEAFTNWRWEPAGPLMAKLRSRKEEEEYQCLKMAQRLSGEALLRLLKEGLSGRTELEAAVRLNEYMREAGLECMGTPLVAAGANGALAHHGADDTVIRRGDPVIIDFGGCCKGYYADITRTVAVGDISEEFANVFRIVRKANEAAAAAARPGMTGEELDAVARKIIDEAGYGAYFTHRLGHGVGLDVHEEPYIVAGNEAPLLAGNVFSNEPGIYLPGRFGVRLEDVLYLREDGAECLTGLTHDILTTE